MNMKYQNTFIENLMNGKIMENGTVTISKDQGYVIVNGFTMGTYRNPLNTSLDWAISQLLSNRFGGINKLLFSNNFVQEIPSLTLACMAEDMIVLEDWGININYKSMPEFKWREILASRLNDESYIKWWMLPKKRKKLKSEFKKKLEKEIKLADGMCKKVLLLAVYEHEFLKSN